MGHYCRICGCLRANEQFSGKGHKIHVCKRCQRLPKSERRAIEDRDDIFGFMQQSHISKKNVARLEQLAKSETPQVASLAAIVLEVARVTPYKRRRLKIIARNHRDLLRRLECYSNVNLSPYWQRKNVTLRAVSLFFRTPFEKFGD